MSSLAALNVPLREVRLHGELGRRFGRVHRLAVRTAGEAVGALCAVLPGFEAYLRQRSEPGYHVCIGKRAKGCDLGPEQLGRPVGRGEPILIIPALAGAKRAGALQTIVGAVLVVAGAYFQNAQLVQLGVSLMLGGVVQMLNAPRKADRQTEVQTKSYGFDAVVNTDDEGLPVPVAIGRVFIGGARVSAGLTADEYTPPPAAPIDPATLPSYMPPDPLDGGAADASPSDGSDSDGVGPSVGDA